MKLSDIISKQAIELRGARILGTVADVKFSTAMKKAESLLLLDDEENDESYLALGVKNVRACDGDMVVAYALSAPLKPFEGNSLNPIGLQCCNQSGKILGRMSDVSLLPDFTVESFSVGEASFSPDKLLSISDKLAVFNDSGEPIKLPKPPRPKAKKTATAQNVKAADILSSFTASETAKDANAAPNNSDTARAVERAAPPASAKTTVSLPVGSAAKGAPPPAYGVATPTAAPAPSPRVCTPDFSFLVGKRVLSDLFASDGTLIAAENSVITAATVAAAGRDNKLVQLTLRAL